MQPSNIKAPLVPATDPELADHLAAAISSILFEHHLADCPEPAHASSHLCGCNARIARAALIAYFNYRKGE